MFKSSICFAVITLVVITSISLFGTNSMHTDGNNMGACPVMNNLASVCTMNAFEHITSWQRFFTTTIQKLGILGLVLLVVLLSFHQVSNLDSRTLLIRYKEYREDHADLGLYNYLLQAFAKGTLQPKLYS